MIRSLVNLDLPAPVRDRATPIRANANTPLESLLSRVWAALDRRRIRHCVLRDGHRLAEGRLAVEVDLLIDASRADDVAAELATLNFVRLRRPGYWPHQFFVAYDETCDGWVKLDVVSHIAFGRPEHALATSLATSFLDGRVRHGAVWTPSAECELLAMLMHHIVDKRWFSIARCERIKQLHRQVANPEALNQWLAKYWSDQMTLARLRRLVNTEDWSGLLAERATIVDRLTRRRPVVTRARRWRDRLLRRCGRWARRIRWEPPCVALLAPDGAGKSTLAEGLKRRFFLPVETVYMGLYGKSKRRTGRLGFGLVFKLATQWARYARGCVHRARGRLVVFDRYTYDARLANDGDDRCVRRLRRWLLARACPRPDLVLILDAPGEELFRRSGEHSAAQLERQRQAYLGLQRTCPGAAVIDTREGPTHVRRCATALIWEATAARLNTRRRPKRAKRPR